MGDGETYIAFFTEREADEAGGEEGEEGGELHCRGAVVVSWDCKRKNFLQMVERELRVEGKKDCDEDARFTVEVA